MLDIVSFDMDFVREPLIAPFGFKGGYVTENWLTSVKLADRSGATGRGTGIQGVLWSDSGVFAEHTASGGNALMALIAENAAKQMIGVASDNPMDLFEAARGEVFAYAKNLTGCDDLRPTFALNAMVPSDNAAWQLYAAINGISDFDDLIPAGYAAPFAYRHEKVAAIPLISYGTSEAEARSLADSGYFVFKIKIGADPDKDGDQDKMLKWDMARLNDLHAVLRDYESPYTDSGKAVYYLDANGRYDSLDRVRRLLDYADAIGALDHIILFEEPFPENSGCDVSSLPVVFAADESAHSDSDAEMLIDLGYRAIALKPIAKTMSMSFKIAAAAKRRGTPCFCADLTVDPQSVDINKNFAARIAPVPGMKIGMLESNGAQNYVGWKRMLGEHRVPDGEWIPVERGVYNLGERFYLQSGGFFEHMHKTPL